MRAVVYDSYQQPPRLTELPDPACPVDGVVVRVGATGICRSDWHAWQGHDPVPLPMVPGHELAGTVVEVGPQVRRWSVGARVTVPFVCGCGRCEQCRAGDEQVCPDQRQPGFTDHGSYAERVALHAADTNLVALPDDLAMTTAASLGCRFATAFRGLTGHRRVAPGEWIAVHGCGGVGLSAAMIAVALGARVVAVDVRRDALALATALGAEATVDAGEVDDVAAAVLEITGGGAHLSMDAVGSPAAATAGVRGLRRRGRHVQAGLLLGEQAALAVPMDLVVALELSVHGTHGMSARDYPELLALVADGSVRPDRLVGAVIALDEAPAALAALGTGEAPSGMTVVDLDC